MNKKYKMIKHSNGLYQIKALRDFGVVKKGTLGGFIEKENNLSHEGDCWVFENAQVYGNARVFGDALVFGNAQVYGNARVYENARVSGDALVFGDVHLSRYKYYDNGIYFVEDFDIVMFI